MTKSTECADRYAFSDEYAIQEMALLYRSANTQRRIELLADWNGHAAYWMPFEIARLAVEDPDDGVRYWMARNAKNLDYRDYLRNGRQARGDETHPERDLKARLRADPQPVIRAAVFENSCIYHFVPQDLSSMSHLDRLAYVRNSNVFLLDVIKLAENETIPLSERQEIILAALTNVKFVESSRGGWETNYEHLWDIVSRWPLEYPGAPVEFCRRIHAPALKKAAIYRACQEPYLRKAIIEGCRESDEMTLELGIDDPDADCRKLAFSKVPPLLITKRINTLKKSDQSAVLGLWTNPNLTLEQQDTVGGYVEDWGQGDVRVKNGGCKTTAATWTVCRHVRAV